MSKSSAMPRKKKRGAHRKHGVGRAKYEGEKFAGKVKRRKNHRAVEKAGRKASRAR